MTKDLKEKAIDFKGKKYVLVSDRVLFFNENYPEGSIITELISAPDSSDVIVKATIYPSKLVEKQFFTAHSQASYNDTSSFVNKSSALENAETSAVGRALAFMGIGVIESIASMDEINKTTYPPKKTAPVKVDPVIAKANARKAIEDTVSLNELMTVSGNIKKSKNLTNEDKEELYTYLDEKRYEFDPTA